MSAFSHLKRSLFGRPLHTKRAHHEKLPVWMALPVFASDALSSTAYATEEIMHVFMDKSIIYLFFTTPIALIICGLILVVSISYQQTIHAYPHGGGSYIVARDNLGPRFGLLAAAALMTDYILTVAVSISAGVLALVSLLPQLQSFGVPIGLMFLALLTIANLRGAKESGLIFAIPTYSFVVLMLLMIVFGFINAAPPEPEAFEQARKAADPDFLKTSAFGLLMFKAFSSGCAAMTGIEAISDGAGAFKEPTAKNATKTLFIMASLLGFLFTGTSLVANKFHIRPFEDIHDPGYMTVVAQTARAVFAGDSFFSQGFFWAIQIATALILVLAANTAFADFPRLSSFVARDSYLPRQLANLGDRLVFQNGITVLAVGAALLLVIFKGNTHLLIPLYAVGVFISFTMSQSGMVARAKKLKNTTWKTYVSLFGAVVSGIIALILLASKFREGAWLVPIVLAALIYIYTRIKHHYDYLAGELEVGAGEIVAKTKTRVLLLVPRMHRGVLQALTYARALSDDVRAIHVTIDPNSTGSLKQAWNEHGGDMPLVILESPYRSLIAPVIDYIDETLNENPDTFVTVIVAEAVPKRWYHKILHSNVGLALKIALASRRKVVIATIRYFLS